MVIDMVVNGWVVAFYHFVADRAFDFADFAALQKGAGIDGRMSRCDH